MATTLEERVSALEAQVAHLLSDKQPAARTSEHRSSLVRAALRRIPGR